MPVAREAHMLGSSYMAAIFTWLRFLLIVLLLWLCHTSGSCIGLCRKNEKIIMNQKDLFDSIDVEFEFVFTVAVFITFLMSVAVFHKYF